MTNEEKAREIGEFFETTYLAALEMAEWKDEQHKEEIEQLKDELDALNMRYLSQVPLYKSLYQGLLDKACEWIMTTPMYAKQPSSLVEEFRKAMEYERTESKNDTQG